ncbi:hypothetical protein K438DRAFT_854266 [Mycena galopus ATCC 62051]|nr:hypothetical protein K438DRAFT_854266 [Mycena galopus ATCC 62051]
MSVDGKKGGKQSRFSTLRVFGKFGKTPGPPPPPPKDAVYLAASNRSLASLSPNESSPASPLSGEQYAASSSSAVSLSLSSSQHSQKTQRSGLFKFATVRKPPSEYSGETSPGGAAEADEGISMPWNFQHNVHVDEGFTGLPPSWTTSLQEAGFSDDEIAAIQQRKMADRPPRDRTNSPPAVVKPVPRTTSLPKNQQQQGQHTPASSLSASSASISSRSSPSPAPDSYSYGSPKIEYASPNTKISPVSPPPVYYEQQLQSLNAPPRRKPPAAPREDSPSRSPPPSRSLSPPQQRAFSPVLAPQVHSRSGSQQSSSSRSHSDFDDDDDERVAYSRSRSRSPSPPPTTTVTAASPAKSNGPSVSNLKNLTLDLGLDISLDGTGWSDAVLSATSLKPAFELNENNNADRKNGLNAAKSPTSPLFTLTAPGKLEEEYSPTELFYPKKGGREREVSGEYSPTGYYGGDYDYDERDFASPERSPASPAFSAELLPPAVGSRERDNRDSGMSDATMLPPQTPLGGARSTMASTRTMDSVGSGETDMNTSPGTQSRPPSTGVVSRIAVARRAVAEVVGVPAVPRAPPPSLPPPSVPPPAPPTRNVLQPPASPQSSNFGSSGGSASGSSESQDHQTPTTEVEADEDDTGELDYYLEGKNYLEKHGFKLEGAHRPRGEGHARTDTRGNGIGVNGTTNTYASAIAEEEKRRTARARRTQRRNALLRNAGRQMRSGSRRGGGGTRSGRRSRRCRSREQRSRWQRRKKRKTRRRYGGRSGRRCRGGKKRGGRCGRRRRRWSGRRRGRWRRRGRGRWRRRGRGRWRRRKRGRRQSRRP